MAPNNMWLLQGEVSKNTGPWRTALSGPPNAENN